MFIQWFEFLTELAVMDNFSLQTEIMFCGYFFIFLEKNVRAVYGPDGEAHEPFSISRSKHSIWDFVRIRKLSEIKCLKFVKRSVGWLFIILLPRSNVYLGGLVFKNWKLRLYINFNIIRYAEPRSDKKKVRLSSEKFVGLDIFFTKYSIWGPS